MGRALNPGLLPRLDKQGIQTLAQILGIRIFQFNDVRNLAHFFPVQLGHQILDHAVRFGNLANHDNLLRSRHFFKGQLPVERPDDLLLVRPAPAKQHVKHRTSSAPNAAALAEEGRQQIRHLHGIHIVQLDNSGFE